MTDGSSGRRPARQFRRTRARRIGDAVLSGLVRLGVVPSTYMLTTTGRRTGRKLTHPATIVTHDGKRWLVSPYGIVSWVHNVRADGRVALSRRFSRHEFTVREVSAQQAGPVLKKYVRLASATRPYFHASKDDPVEDFIAEADRHPVFEMTPVR